MNPDYSQNRSISSFMYKVYGWMTAGLFVTAATAYGVYTYPPLFTAIMSSHLIIIGLFIAQIALVIALSAFINKMNFATAALMFITYSALLGLTLSSIFFMYQIGSIYMVFGITVGMFGTMALYGYATGADLSSFGNIMFMGLIGLIIGSVVNIFLRSNMFGYILSFLGVAVFTGLVAYDVQRIKYMGLQMLGYGAAEGKVALLGALTLYLDFINLFLFLLQLLGKRRN